MIIGKVIGNVVTSIQFPDYEGKKIMFVQPTDHLGNNKGTSFLAVDAVQAGVGDKVLVLEEGTGGRQIIGEKDSMTIKCVIAAIIDEINVPK